MLNRKKKQNVEVNRTVPIVRYYSSVKTNTKPTKTLVSKTKPINNAQNQNNRSPFIQYLLLLGILIILLFNLTLQNIIIKDDSSENVYRSKQEYIDKANQLFNDSFFHKSKLTLRSMEFENLLVNEFPELDSATVVIPLAGRSLQVQLEISQPFAKLATMNNKNIYISSNGKALFLSDSVVSLNSDLPNITITPEITLQQGTAVLTTSEIELFELLKGEFDGSTDYRPEINSFQFDITKREVQVNFKNSTFFAKVTPEREARSQVGALVTTLKYLLEQGTAPKLYIDARVEDRVFVK